MRTMKRGRRQSLTEEQCATRSVIVENDKLLAAFAKIGRDGHEWLVPVQSTGGAASSSSCIAGDDIADDTTMTNVQQSFDATTVLTLAVKRLGQELIRSGALSDQGQGMVVQGIALCRELVAPMEAIENILTANKRKSRQDANKALSDAARLQQKPNINKTLQTTNTDIETNTNIMCCIYVVICVYVLCNCVCIVIQ
jgi:hypothetical protein